MTIICNKRIIISLALIVLSFTVIYSAQIDYSKASDKTHDYEYYYNDTEHGGFAMSSSTIDSSTDQEPVLPEKIETDPASVTVLVNRTHPLEQDYVPEDLTVPDITFRTQGFQEKKQLRQVAADAIEELFQAAEQNGLSLCGISGYRSYARQNVIYTNNLRKKGVSYTEQYSAKAGYSEHQTGLAMDVSAASVRYSLTEQFADTPEGIWLSENAHLYGFIIRYPKGKSSVVGYAYEPWHIRYVGTELATLLYENNLTLDEYYGSFPVSSNLDTPDASVVFSEEAQ